MKKLFLLLFLLLSACASKDQYFHPSYFVLTEGSEGSKLNYPELFKRLTKTSTMAGGLYEVSVTPLTTPLLEAQAKFQGEWKHLSSEEILSLSQNLKKIYTEGKTCIEFKAQILRFEGASKTNDWKMSLYTDLTMMREGENDAQERTAKEFELTWITPLPEIVKSQVTKIQDKYDQWLLSAVACTYRELPLENGFAIKVIAPYINFPFSEQLRLDYGNWSNYDDDHLMAAQKEKGQDTPSSSSKIKRQNNQRYRGW